MSFRNNRCSLERPIAPRTLQKPATSIEENEITYHAKVNQIQERDSEASRVFL
jgi:hypothetical protein